MREEAYKETEERNSDRGKAAGVHEGGTQWGAPPGEDPEEDLDGGGYTQHKKKTHPQTHTDMLVRTDGEVLAEEREGRQETGEEKLHDTHTHTPTRGIQKGRKGSG